MILILLNLQFDGIPYAIDFGNPAPDADVNSVGEENFEWVVEESAKMATKSCKKSKKTRQNKLD
jgi:hypothetical protein